ncbi:MAG: DUF3309 domain-containing protein [Luteolibacter sp.]
MGLLLLIFLIFLLLGGIPMGAGGLFYGPVGLVLLILIVLIVLGRL